MIDYSRIESSGVKKVMYFDSIPSTNLFAKTCINEDDLLIIAGHQSEGRGRLNRTWESERNKNITLSLIKSFDIQYPHLINFYTSYIVQRVLKEYIMKQAGSDADVLSLKWPNDIMLKDKKAGGILSELIDINESPKKFIIGIGINVNQESFPAELTNKAISLKNYYSNNFSVEDIIYSLISQFYYNLALLDKKDILMELWRLNCSMIGKNVRFRHTDVVEEIEGNVIDICNDGGIKIKTSENCNSKNIYTYYTGEISFIY
jgi:BirA family biotin operon repressor/biotin-[acetyl-CoA-carboxylase] ligase